MLLWLGLQIRYVLRGEDTSLLRGGEVPVTSNEPTTRKSTARPVEGVQETPIFSLFPVYLTCYNLV